MRTRIFRSPDSPTGTPGTATAAAGAIPEETIELPDSIISDDDDGIDLGIFEQKDDTEDSTTSAAAAVEAAPTAVTSAAQTVAPAAIATAAVSVTPAITTSAAAAISTETPAPAAAVSPPGTPTDPVAAFTAWRGNAEKLLAENHYALPQETLDEIADNPAVALPKLMARVYLDAVTASTNVLIQNLPAILENTLGYRDNAKKLEDQFDSEWKGLAKHRDKVIQIGQVYRQLNPKATAEEFTRDVGAQAAFALGLTLEVAKGSAAPAVAPRTGPTAPHRPPGAAAHQVGQPAQPDNQFTALALDID